MFPDLLSKRSIKKEKQKEERRKKEEKREEEKGRQKEEEKKEGRRKKKSLPIFLSFDGMDHPSCGLMEENERKNA